MNIFNIFIVGYLMGGLTLFPLLLALYVYLPNKPLHNIPYLDQLKKKLTIITTTTSTTTMATAKTTTTNTNNKEEENSNISNNSTATATALYKVGWLRMTFGSPPIISLKKPDQRSYFTVLKQHTLFLYDSEEQYDCQLVLSLKDYKVSVYPEDVLDPELFSRPYWIQLKPLVSNENNHTYYFHCHVCIEKEDWYHIFLQASGQPKFPQPMSLEPLIQMIHSNSHHLEIQWFNALLSRLFMGIHLTKRFHQAIEKKIMAKVDKINARKPPFLGEIQVRNIDIGKQNGSIPFITQPKLLSVSPQGECWLEFMLDYHGNNCTIEIATVLQWSYSDRLPPLTMDIVLSVSLQSIQGKMKLLIKPPPSNRLWYGFEGLPKMKWNIVPLVWEKKIGHSMVVKAIIKHLEEVFSDTMVLPHMDDTTFFDNAGFGGIYQDDMILHHDNNQDEMKMEDITIMENNNNNDNNINNNNNNINNHGGDHSVTDSVQLMKSHSSTTTTYIKNKNNKKGLFKTSPTSVSLSHLSSMDTQTSSLSPSASSETNNSSNSNNNKKASTEPIPIQNNKKDQLAKKLPLPNKKKNNKKENLERKKMKQQDIKLLSTVKSLPELISAHTSQHPSSQQQQQQQQQQQNDEEDTSFFLSTSPSNHNNNNHNHNNNDFSSSSSFTSHSLSPPKLNESLSTTTKSMPIFLSTSSSSTTTTSSSSSSSSSSLATSIQPNDIEEKSNHDNNVLSTSPNAPPPPPKLPTDQIEEGNNNNNNMDQQQQQPTLRARKSMAHLTQKTSASTAITQISPAVGVFLGKQLPTIKTTN